MKILFVGDVVGRCGREVLDARLKEVQVQNQIDFTVANVENVAGGFGITPALAEEILSCGVDVMTSGNHIWDRKEVLDYFSRQPRLLRPGNYPAGVPGNHQFVGETRAGTAVAVMNLQGRVFMPIIDCPFRLAEREIPKLAQKARVILIDFHAEATSEKMAFGWFVDGKVSAVVGTHTHVPTADERIFPQGTAYISDVGMTGSYDSVIGVKADDAISRFLTGLRTPFGSATGSPRFASVVVDVDEQTGQARTLRRLNLES